ncbi:MAG: hypothetical protein LAT76_10280 [Schleiferiaceae bacterium]|nr:hypothetical protein [Schleiferiaceae bacterium]
MKRDYSAKIEQLKTDGYTFSIRNVLGKSFQLFKKSAGLYIAFIVIMFFINIGVALISLKVELLNLLSSYVVSPILFTGLIAFSYKLSRNEDAQMSDFFSTIGQFKEYGLAYFLSRVIAAIPLGVVALIFMERSGFIYEAWMNNNYDFGEMMTLNYGLGFTLTMLGAFFVMFYFTICYAMVLPFFLFNDRDKTIFEALEDLRKITQKRFFKFFGLFLALVFINILGAIALIIGLFVTIPVSMITLFVVFDEIFGTGDADENRDFEFEELKWD